MPAHLIGELEGRGAGNEVKTLFADLNDRLGMWRPKSPPARVRLASPLIAPITWNSQALIDSVDPQPVLESWSTQL
jgi:hypothetical protein